MNAITQTESVTVLELPFKSIDASNAASFRGLLEQELDPGRRLIVDFSTVEFVDSAGLGAIVWAIRHLAELQGEIRLCCPRKAVQALFDLVRMNRITAVFGSQDEALNSFT